MVRAHSYRDHLRQISREAYDAIRNEGTLGEMQDRVLYLIATFPDSTARELTRHLVERWAGPEDPNRLRPRIAELIKANRVEESGTRVCSVSGLRATTWRVKIDSCQKELF